MFKIKKETKVPFNIEILFRLNLVCVYFLTTSSTGFTATVVSTAAGIVTVVSVQITVVESIAASILSSLTPQDVKAKATNKIK